MVCITSVIYSIHLLNTNLIIGADSRLSELVEKQGLCTSFKFYHRQIILLTELIISL